GASGAATWGSRPWTSSARPVRSSPRPATASTSSTTCSGRTCSAGRRPSTPALPKSSATSSASVSSDCPGNPGSRETASKGAFVNFAFSEEQEELRRSVRRFLEDKSPVTEVRRLMETTEGFDPAVWKQMGEQLGLQGLAVPEEYGGSGYRYVELIRVFEEKGRALV